MRTDTTDIAQVPPVPLGTASFGLRDGSTVIPLVDGNPTFARIVTLLDASARSVWITVSFVDVEGWRSPRGETFFNMLAAHASRGIDVRLLIWRLEFDNRVLHNRKSTFFGPRPGVSLPDGVKIRWDSSGPDPRHCHHEKSWVFDGDTRVPVAVQGGIVLTQREMATPGHPRAEVLSGRTFHDVNVEVRGRAAGDIAAHFVQRWNDAHRHEEEDGHWPSLAKAGPLQPPPTAVPQGDVSVQVLRTLRPGQLRAARPQGEASILEIHRAAITGARHTIYIEQQHIAHPALLRLLEQACDRGVKVLYLVPSEPCFLRSRLPCWLATLIEAVLAPRFVGRATAAVMAGVAWVLRRLFPFPATTTLTGEKLPMPSPDCDESFLSLVPRLCQHPNFVLAGLLSSRPIYVHSKLLIADDNVLIVGSANLVDLSLESDHTELAVAAWGEPARKMRDLLYAEHAGCETIPAEHRGSPVSALVWLADRARNNAARLATGEPMDGNIIGIGGRLYGNVLYLVNTFVLERLSRRAKRRPLRGGAAITNSEEHGTGGSSTFSRHGPS